MLSDFTHKVEDENFIRYIIDKIDMMDQRISSVLGSNEKISPESNLTREIRLIHDLLTSSDNPSKAFLYTCRNQLSSLRYAIHNSTIITGNDYDVCAQLIAESQAILQMYFENMRNKIRESEDLL